LERLLCTLSDCQYHGLFSHPRLPGSNWQYWRSVYFRLNASPHSLQKVLCRVYFFYLTFHCLGKTDLLVVNHLIITFKYKINKFCSLIWMSSSCLNLASWLSVSKYFSHHLCVKLIHSASISLRLFYFLTDLFIHSSLYIFYKLV
jgi:hypothetical protein